jgi:hypothetical protein
MMKKTLHLKELKRKVVYQEGYSKGTVCTDKDQIIEIMKRPDITIFAINAGKYEDGKEFITVKIDNIINTK